VPRKKKKKKRIQNLVSFAADSSKATPPRARTDDDVHVPVRETRIDQNTADFFLRAAREGRGRGQVDVHVIRPLEAHARTTLRAQCARVAARVDDGQPDEVLYQDEARRGERRAPRANEDGELQAPWWREPCVGAAATPCELESREGDDRRGERR
jgi:hypothetical protein